MSVRFRKVLVVGATGSIGRLVVEEALKAGFDVRALVRDAGRARSLAGGVELVVGDLTRPETLAAAVAGVDGIVFAHGSYYGVEAGSENVDYGGVPNVLAALDGRRVRIALMTTIGVTSRSIKYAAEGAWKRRGERLLRVSGLPYTIVRPGWFDHNDPDQHRLVLLQGDTRHAGDPSDGVIARRQVAEVLVASLTSAAAEGKTFELVAERGPAQDDLDPLFAALDGDPPGALDGVRDADNMPLDEEPARVRADLEVAARWEWA